MWCVVAWQIMISWAFALPLDHGQMVFNLCCKCIELWVNYSAACFFIRELRCKDASSDQAHCLETACRLGPHGRDRVPAGWNHYCTKIPNVTVSVVTIRIVTAAQYNNYDRVSENNDHLYLSFNKGSVFCNFSSQRKLKRQLTGLTSDEWRLGRLLLVMSSVLCKS